MSVGIPASSAGRDAAERGADRGHARGALVAQHLRERLAVADEVRAVGIGREVLVGEREDLPRLDLGEHVLPARAGRVDQRVARDDVEPVAPVRPAERLGDPAVLPSASCKPTMSASAAWIARTTPPKSTTSPPSQMLNDMTRTSVGVRGAALAGAAALSAAATTTARTAAARRMRLGLRLLLGGRGVLAALRLPGRGAEPRVLGDELLGRLARLVVRALRVAATS